MICLLNFEYFQGVVLFGLLNPQQLQYNDYLYPNWAVLLGWGLAMSSILMIPIVAITQLCKTKGDFTEVSFSIFTL